MLCLLEIKFRLLFTSLNINKISNTKKCMRSTIVAEIQIISFISRDSKLFIPGSWNNFKPIVAEQQHN